MNKMKQNTGVDDVTVKVVKDAFNVCGDVLLSVINES